MATERAESVLDFIEGAMAYDEGGVLSVVGSGRPVRIVGALWRVRHEREVRVQQEALLLWIQDYNRAYGPFAEEEKT